jgi:hypothetical protein
LLYLLDQGGKQENQLIEVKQTPPKQMRKLQTWLQDVLQERQEKKGLVMRSTRLSIHSEPIMSILYGEWIVNTLTELRTLHWGKSVHGEPD